MKVEHVIRETTVSHLHRLLDGYAVLALRSYLHSQCTVIYGSNVSTTFQMDFVSEIVASSNITLTQISNQWPNLLTEFHLVHT